MAGMEQDKQKGSRKDSPPARETEVSPQTEEAAMTAAPGNPIEGTLPPATAIEARGQDEPAFNIVVDEIPMSQRIGRREQETAQKDGIIKRARDAYNEAPTRLKGAILFTGIMGGAAMGGAIGAGAGFISAGAILLEAGIGAAPWDGLFVVGATMGGGTILANIGSRVGGVLAKKITGQ